MSGPELQSEGERLARELESKLAAIRRREAAGGLTVTEAAAERIQIMERYLTASAALRQRHPGG